MRRPGSGSHVCVQRVNRSEQQQSLDRHTEQCLSFLASNWTSVDDKITWDAQVVAGGEYEVEIYYTCPQQDVGATIELSFNDARLQGRIRQAHDPPLRGAEHDRVERMESYIKDFRAMPLGTIRLEAGRGEFTLRALEMPGSQVMDFRLMMFTRVE